MAHTRATSRMASIGKGLTDGSHRDDVYGN